MRVSFIVAKSKNNVIGINNTLPWHLKADLANFKKITSGHHILMGRKTFESIGKPLPQRVSLVVSSNPREISENLFWFNSIFKAIKFAERAGESELFIIGGEKIFRYALSLIDRIYLTEVDCEIAGDAFFPVLTAKKYKLVSETKFTKDIDNDYDFTFKILDKK